MKEAVENISTPKIKAIIKQTYCYTEFEVRLHSYREIHHPTPPQTQLVYSKLGRADITVKALPGNLGS